jgi:hypothetical protein
VLLVEAIQDPAELAAVERRWARPARSVAALLNVARTEAARPESTVEDVLWAVWSASGLGGRWAAQSARGGPRGETADRDLDAVVALFDAAARFVDRAAGRPHRGVPRPRLRQELAVRRDGAGRRPG